MRYPTAIIATLVLFAGGGLIGPSEGRANADDDALLIIANKAVPENSISVAEVQRIFLKMRSSWPSGGKVIPVNAKPDTPERRAFQEKVLGMDANAELSYWQEQKVKRGATPPPEFSNAQRAVFSLKGGIGYCLKSSYYAGTTKILLKL
jgi:hypothetical protein